MLSHLANRLKEKSLIVSKNAYVKNKIKLYSVGEWAICFPGPAPAVCLADNSASWSWDQSQA